MLTLSEIQSECSISFVWASVCPKILRALPSSHKQTQGMLTCFGTELLCPGPEPWRDLPNLDLSVNAPFATPITTTREWQPTPVFLPEEFHGLRSVPGYNPWGHKESGITEQLTHTHTHTK